MSNEPFGRQPEPVTVQLAGNPIDVDYWTRELMRRAEFKGDQVLRVNSDAGYAGFRIFPRAVND
jgi:hypothetical protein